MTTIILDCYRLLLTATKSDRRSRLTQTAVGLITTTLMALVIALASPVADAQVFTTISDPSGLSTYALGISGSAVVGYYRPASGLASGFIYYNSTYSTVNLGTQTFFTGVTNGATTGYYYTNTSSPVSFEDGSSYITFTIPPGVNGTFAQGISGNNVVGRYTDSSNTSHGFLYNGSGFSIINDPLGINGTSAQGMSGSNVVGYYIDSSNVYHGFLFNGSAYTTLSDPLAGSFGTEAMGIDGSNVVGYYFDSIGHANGFLYNILSNTYTSFSDPLGTGTFATGISGNNIVGYYTGPSGTNGFEYSIPSGNGTPEPGASALFIGTGITGFCLIARRKRALLKKV